ncbi:7,8-didemethyl-8-hydroxy-5-deazariboflavin synthase CofG [Microbacterium sp. M3]|uniref:7,8-didemethyl-8-hydroxy-5-deazariboflavin synthase n=1 Tax=Microbacterium arthrosphaerae TaxID=792652 RepID=A0ABU4GYM4_9MICO|nr:MULTISPECIES: 7,8-didemethyl-8-hydroxy-5-deazariboflavin synthase CofG [Microbacterium]MDW4572171.1 7,8-didemethyl-8-hydroxy-5-deazariboflavin synthase CofG [Microbacterium arthrosphaerae]MDW7606026.1 7,8-didemethyl-8-hydroxy-5-deazariboflavin synthase CofG [Microbacterium sp. M3]
MTVVSPSVTTPPAVASPAAVDAALARAATGERLDVADAAALLAATGERFERLLALAGAVRDAGLAASGRPGVITYSRKVFVPLTTLCRDRCHYCVFVDTPGQLLKKHKPAYMSPEQVLAVVRQGQAMGCKEVLLTLGDRPEERWPEARAWLDEHGFASTIDYVAHIARLVTAETGLLAHANPGVMSADELRTLRPVAPSMGMMLETTSRRLFEEPGQVHFGSPDKDPAVRLEVIDAAGRERVPFTTGILVGIGETLHDRAESLVAIRDAHERHQVDGAAGPQGHVQEVIVQNFRAKPRTAMQGAPDAELLEYVAAVAVARLVMGPRMRIQVPPNLSDPAEFGLLVRAGANDWGGVSPLTADHVNPERPWPHLDDLARMTADLGFELRERLTAQPEFVLDAGTWIDPALRGPVAALADPETGLAARPHVAGEVSPEQDAFRLGRSAPSLNDREEVDPRSSSDHADPGPRSLSERSDTKRAAPHARLTGVRRLAEAAAADPLALDDTQWVALLEATGDDLDVLAATADDVRRYTVGEAVTLVVNRNLTSSGLRTAPDTADPATFTLDDVGAIAADAWELGATELCVQGLLPTSEDPSGYLDIARGVRAAAPGIHLHAYRPQDVRDLADRTGLGLDGALTALRDAGVDTVPGTGVKVLNERVRALVAPADLEIDRWVEGITAAHRAGLRSTSVLFYGHVETAAERIAHLRRLRAIQSETGGFTEFVPIPLPGPAGGVPLVAGREPLDEHRAMVAVSRLLLSGSIPHVQIPWTRVGREASVVLLQSGGDDLGGTLLDGRVKPAAGIEHGLELPVTDAAALAARLFRPFRRRTTTYGQVTR